MTKNFCISCHLPVVKDRTGKDPVGHRMAGDIKINFEKQISRSESTTSSVGSLSDLHQVIDTGTLLCYSLFYGWFLVN